MNYLAQNYHIDYEIHDRYLQDLLSFGSDISLKLESMRAELFDTESSQSIYDNNLTESKTMPKAEQPKVIAPTIEMQEIPQIAQGMRIQDGRLYVEPNATFLLIGDSMMQGIGMTLVSSLTKMGFKAINKAKQSTGLTYIGFFNWEQALYDELQSNPHISVIVVCLGANDPWDMRGARFGSDKWNGIYNSRIQHIYSMAKEHNALVVWYEAPAVKKPSLNAKLSVLNEFYAINAREQGGLFIKARNILDQGKFIYYLKNEDGKSIAVRTQDGIHFTRQGSLILTKSLIDRIEILESTSKDSNNAPPIEPMIPPQVPIAPLNNILFNLHPMPSYIEKDNQYALYVHDSNSM